MARAGKGEESGGGYVSLTYDGADPSHLEVAIPCLERLGLVGTFLLEPVAMLQRAQEWRTAASNGQEMGCHCLLGATDAHGNLRNWTLEMVEAELRENRKLLADQFAEQSDFPFAYPGPETGCLTVAFNPMKTSYRHMAERVFSVARAGQQGLNDPSNCPFGYLNCMDAEALDAAALTGIVNEAARSRHWAILRFRGIGVGDRGTDASAHAAFCERLAQRADVVVSPLLKMAYRLRSAREAPEHSLFLNDGGGR